MMPGGHLHPPIGLGLWAVGRWGPDDEIRTRTALDRGLSVGLKWFDTAEVYGAGRSERMLGDALHGLGPEGRDLLVTTKVSWEHLRAGQVRAALIGSLRRLGLESVGIYLIHAPDPKVPIAETLGALAALRSEGRIGAIGVSNFGIEELEKAAAVAPAVPIAVNQVRYNLFDREDGDAVREYCAKTGIVLEAYTPLLRGLLAGRYLDRQRPPKDLVRLSHRLLGDEELSEVVERGRAIRALAEREKLPMASIALHWLRRRGAAPLIGASRPEQVDQAVDAWARVPDDRVLDEADRIGRGDRA